jgi:dihydrofolate reductase
LRPAARTNRRTRSVKEAIQKQLAAYKRLVTAIDDTGGFSNEPKGAVMGRIVVVEYMSLDGVIEDPGPTGAFEHRGWTMPYWSDEVAAWQTDQLFASEALLLGRVTYDEFSAAWSQRSGDPFTDRMNSLPKHVASTTLRGQLEWEAKLLEGDPLSTAAALKEEAGGDILVYGSSGLVKALMERDLIDEYRLLIYPLVLGSGKRLFGEGGPKTLKLVRTESASTGVVMLVLEPAT